jgi:hypothetical protein
VTGKHLTLQLYLGKDVCMATVEVKRMGAARRGRNMMKLDELLFEGKERRGMA